MSLGNLVTCIYRNIRVFLTNSFLLLMLLFACDFFFSSLIRFLKGKNKRARDSDHRHEISSGDPTDVFFVKGWALWQGQMLWDCVDRQLVIIHLLSPFSHGLQMAILANVLLWQKLLRPERLSWDKIWMETRDSLVRCNWFLRSLKHWYPTFTFSPGKQLIRSLMGLWVLLSWSRKLNFQNSDTQEILSLFVSLL